MNAIILLTTKFRSPRTSLVLFSTFFFFNDTATTEIYTLSLHDALPIFHRPLPGAFAGGLELDPCALDEGLHPELGEEVVCRPKLGAGVEASPFASEPLAVQQVRAREVRSEEHTSELQSRPHLVCRLLLE